MDSFIDSLKCGHFLRVRDQEALRRYAQDPLKREGDYERLVKEIQTADPYAFHNHETVMKRRFYHCPVTPIPYHSCYKK